MKKGHMEELGAEINPLDMIHEKSDSIEISLGIGE